MRSGSVLAMALALATSTAALAQADAPARDTPGLPSHLHEIDIALPGGLLNDPTTLDWTAYGGAFGRELVVDESYPGGGAALRLHQGRSGPVYDGGISVPLLGPIRDGDIVTVGFFARTIESAADGGTGRVRVRFQLDRDPYPGFGDQVLEIGSQWRWYEVSATADRTIRRDGIVSLQFGLARQVVEIGQMVVVSGTASIGG